ncbi:MAG: shikimate kinase [Gammaproteobacteria bacterium]|nr:shikimate kinase [Gammaproteobacteria bacterium]
MSTHAKTIVLIGFKHVGKSVIGRALATQLERPFIDLDEEIERVFEREHQDKQTCRQMMQTQGEAYFRQLEKDVLAQLVLTKPVILSLGGGTPLDEDNQKRIQGHTIVHISAPRGVVFERIMLQGRPAFFSDDESPVESFNRLWNERERVYETLASFSIENNGAVMAGVEQVLQHLAIHKGQS